MHAGRVEEAGALAARFDKEIARHSQQQLKHIDGRTNAAKNKVSRHPAFT